MIEVLRQSGGSPRYSESYALTSDVDWSSGLGSHDAWTEAYALGELDEWLARPSR